MFRQIGAPEIILILAVVILLFGAKKLPDLARGSGRALRIFKAETKGLIDDDEDETAAAATPLEVRAPEAVAPQVQAEAETQAKTTD
ncbi:MAG: Sec-independent protein translocase subunit TatA [Marmoricola sp.]